MPWAAVHTVCVQACQEETLRHVVAWRVPRLTPSSCVLHVRPTIDKILAMLPNKSQRQTLLFSATFPHNVKELARFALRPAYSTVDTVGEEASTNQQVRICACCLFLRSTRVLLLKAFI